MAKAANFLVVGECGNGKSTLINGLRDVAKTREAQSGRNPRGVTKSIALYPCQAGNGTVFNLIDTPGIGDQQVSPLQLLSMIEVFLDGGLVPINGLIVTMPVEHCRVTLGMQIVQCIVDMGFVAPAGADKYSNVILCGTKRDKAEPADEQGFMHDVRSLFFKSSPRRTGPCVMVSRQDYGPLVDALRQLPALSIAYEQPNTEVMAAALARKLGLEQSDAQGHLAATRAEVAHQKAQLQELMRKMRDDMRQYIEESAKRDRQLQRIAAQIQEDEERAKQARQQRERDLEHWRREQDQNRRREREEAAEAQRKEVERLQQELERNRESVRMLQRQNAEAERKHEEWMLQLQQQHQREMAVIAEGQGTRESGLRPWAASILQFSVQTILPPLVTRLVGPLR